MQSLPWLNYHHLLYFREIVRAGGMTRAAAKLNLTQSTLSAQLRALEESLGESLFERRGRTLVLTEAGRVALDYAEIIFGTGDELRSWFSSRHNETTAPVIKVGALSPMSKNLQYEMVRPLLMEGMRLRVEEGEMDEMLERLRRHRLDVLLSNIPLGGADTQGLHVHLIGEAAVFLVGRPPFKLPRKPFPQWLEGVPLFLPPQRTSARIDFDAMLIRKGVRPDVLAEVDDMALLRLLAMSGAGLALVPEIGVKFDLQEKRLLRIERVPSLHERFFAITVSRKRPLQWLEKFLQSGHQALVAMHATGLKPTALKKPTRRGKK